MWGMGLEARLSHGYMSVIGSTEVAPADLELCLEFPQAPPTPEGLRS